MEKVVELVHKGVYIPELTVNRGKSDISDLVDTLELIHGKFADLKGRNLSVERTLKRRLDFIHGEEMYTSTMTDGLIKAKVEVTELMGAETYLYLNCEGNNFTARVDPSTLAKSGDEITVALDTNKIHIFDKETEKTITN